MIDSLVSRRSSVALLCGGVLAAPSVMAQQVPRGPLEQVIVSATRTGEGMRTDVLGSSVTVLSPEQLEQRQARVISEVLRDVPGVAVSRAGAVGGLTQVRVRGTEGNHVLVLIDGMEAADPYYGEFDFATLIADDVARVEVLRGQQSALHGSDAIGGVIHYMTPSGREAPGVSARVEGGSFNTWESAARFAGATEKLDYALSAGHHTTDGIATSFFGTRKVGADNTSASGRLQYDVTEDMRLKTIVRYTRAAGDSNDTDYSSPYGVPPYGWVIDSDDRYRNTALYGFISAQFDAFDDRWVNTISVQGADAQRDSFSDGRRASGSEGARLKASYVSSAQFGVEAWAHTLTVAADFEREQMQNTGPGINASQAIKRQVDNIGLVAQYNAVFEERIGFGVAVRHDDNDRFDNANTYRVQGSYRFESGTRLRAAAGSGIKSPTMFELYGYNPDRYLGNPGLKPERSKGWEIGVEQSFAANRALVGVTYFDSRLQDEIYTVYSAAISSPANRPTDSTQRGVEVFAAARFGAWSLDASYTHLDANENGVEEVRRPPHIGSVSLGWRAFEDALGLNITARYNGTMLDNNFTGVGPSLIELNDFTLVNFSTDYRVSDRVQLYGRIENLLDEDYVEVYTYRSPGRAAYAGVRITF